ncbi:hypothetical protein L9F63_025214, partial [Diploptera punctata]
STIRCMSANATVIATSNKSVIAAMIGTSYFSLSRNYLLIHVLRIDNTNVFFQEGFVITTVYFRISVMQKSCRCTFMYGELTDKETIARIDECLENQIHDQFEILLYKKNSDEPGSENPTNVNQEEQMPADETGEEE